MEIREILVIISSIISVLFSSGAFVALFLIRANNNKILAEANKLKAEAEQIGSDIKLDSFKTQIEGIKVISGTMSSRLDSLTKQIKEYELRDEINEKKIDELENSARKNDFEKEQLKRAIDIIRKLMINLLKIFHDYCELNQGSLIERRASDFGLKKLIEDIEDIESQYNNFESSYKDWTGVK